MKDQLLRVDEVLEIVKFSKATLYKAMKRGKFPRPVKFGVSAFWRTRDVQAWLDALLGKKESA